MNPSTSSNSQLSLTPLGAGDLIDRAVRFYRQNFWTFVWIAAPPIFVSSWYFESTNFYEEVRRFETDLIRRVFDKTGG